MIYEFPLKPIFKDDFPIKPSMYGWRLNSPVRYALGASWLRWGVRRRSSNARSLVHLDELGQWSEPLAAFGSTFQWWETSRKIFTRNGIIYSSKLDLILKIERTPRSPPWDASPMVQSLAGCMLRLPKKHGQSPGLAALQLWELWKALREASTRGEDAAVRLNAFCTTNGANRSLDRIFDVPKISSKGQVRSGTRQRPTLLLRLVLFLNLFV